MVERNNKNAIINIWFGILMLYIATGFFAQDVIMPSWVNSLFLYLFLAYSVIGMVFMGRIKLTFHLGWLAVFMLMSLLAMLYSPSFSIFGGTYYSLIVNFILVLFLTQMPWDIKRFQAIMHVFTLSGAALIIVLTITGNLEDASGRLGTEAFGNSNILATMLMVSAMYGFWLLISSDKFPCKVLYIAEVVIIYFGMFLCGGRKFVIVPVVFLYVLLLHRTDSKGRKHIIRNTLLVATLLVTLYLLIINVPLFYESIGYRFEGFFALFSSQYEIDGSTQIRELMRKAALSQWLKNPLWGYGFDSFKYYNAHSLTGYEYYSHNNFTELLYNQGLIGFAAYYVFYAYLLIASRKQKNKLHRGFSVGTVLSLLVFEYGAVTYSITNVQFMIFFVLYCIKATTEDEPSYKKINDI